MDSSHRGSDTSDDLSALAWVQDELRRSLDAATKALRRYVKEADSQFGADIDVVDPSVLRSARQQLHQGVGALELVGLPAVASLLRASEAAVQRFAARPRTLTTPAVDALERASFALLEYLARLLAGKPVSPLALFPQYRAVQELAGADRIHPADLWHEDWHWRELPADPTAPGPLPADAITRAVIESQLLELMRSGLPAASQHMSDLFAGLGAAASDPQTSTLWQLAAGLFEAQAQGLLRPDNYTKRIASRLLAQLRMIERGETAVSERLAQDLLFFCAHCTSPGDGRRAPRLASVRQTFGLVHYEPVDYETSRLGRFDPSWLAQARKRVSAAKEAWSSVAGGEMHRLAGLNEQIALVADSVRRLYPSGDVLAAELSAAVAQTVHEGAAPSPSLAMEVATSVLYLEASLEDGELDHPQLGFRIQRLAGRLATVRAGQTAEPLEAWMEELYRRVSDRQTMGSVVQELRVSLAEAEKHIDQYFRNPSDRNALIPVPNQLSAMRGVLSVLGMEQASAAVLHMRNAVDDLMSTEVDQERSAYNQVFERLAANLGALGFLIDMLSVQPQMAKSLFVFDAESGALNPVMGRQKHGSWTGNELPGVIMPVEPLLIEQAQSLAVSAIRDDVPVDEVSRDLERLSHQALVADQPALAATAAAAQAALERAEDSTGESAAREQLALAMSDFVITASDAESLQPETRALRESPVSVPAPVAAAAGAAGSLHDDPEMLEIFLEEAREVLETSRSALAELVTEPADLGQLTAVRRAFHTLKGSGRMVGLNDFGEAAWACEQLYNARLAQTPQADEPLLEFSRQAVAYLGDWVENISAGGGLRHEAGAVRAAADALRLEGRTKLLSLPTAPGEDAFVPSGLPSDLPTAADLDLTVVSMAAPALDISAAESTPGAGAEAVQAFGEMDFELDLRSLDEIQAEAPRSVVAAALEDPADDDAPDDLSRTVPLPLLEDDLPALSQVAESVELMAFDLGLDLDLDVSAPADTKETEPSQPFLDAMLSEPSPAAEVTSESDALANEVPAAIGDSDQVKLVGPLRIGIPLFNIFLNEADELSRRLTTELAEWAMELERPVGEAAIALAHSLAGSSATVGFTDLSHLSRALEHALMRSNAIGRGTPEEGELFVRVADEIRKLLHQFAAGFLKSPAPELAQRLSDHEVSSSRRLEAQAAAADIAATGEDGSESVQASSLAGAAHEAPADAEMQGAAGSPPSFEARGEEPASEAQTAPAPPTPAKAPASVAAIGAFGQGALKGLGVLHGEVVHVTPKRASALDGEDDLDAVDAVDAELFPIFQEEGQELLPQLATRLRDWSRRPGDAGLAAACMRTLHTLKGGARLAGAMRLGELAHRLETSIEHVLSRGEVQPRDVEPLLGRADALLATFEALGAPVSDAGIASPMQEERLPQVRTDADAGEVAIATPAAEEPAPQAQDLDTMPPAAEKLQTQAADISRNAEPVHADGAADIDWTRFLGAPVDAQAVAQRPAAAASQSAVRVRAPLLDRLVNQAGEISITRSRVELEVAQLKGSLGDLTDNLDRLRGQLRDIELQAETQMASRMEAAKAAAETFDPLEFDRFTRFQELTRMMAESVNDVATVQRTLQRTLEATEDELVAQARLTRDLQDDLLRTRMVEFEGLSERLYRVVRQAAKETGKQVRLDIIGGSIEVDRGVLDRMTGAFEHLLRNCVTHGIEPPDARSAAGKDATGTIVVALSHEGNEVGVEFRDDGQGLQLERIREKGIALGMLDPQQTHTDAELANLIFTPGFSTAESISELAGRGIGMDVVRSEINAMGGRIETATEPGRGTSFKLVLPLTTAVTQVVMLRSGETTVAVPSTLVETVLRARPEEMAQAYASGAFVFGSETLPFFWLGALLQMGTHGTETGRTLPVVVIRSAQQRIAIHVDAVLGNQEVVVKNLGPQLSRMPGLAGMTLLPSGLPALIYNPVALATLYGESARAATAAALRGGGAAEQGREEPVAAAPLVLVVDDSLTVRRVTQRLLVREGFRVTLAKDGLDALERLAEEKPDVVLSDIEMPRMDGFDLVRNLRGDARWRELPVIMITSRIAQKHRDHAAELGVDHYLGKPYSEEDLLALLHQYVGAEAAP